MSGSRRARYELLDCPECRDDTRILIDERQGVVLCRNCGLVLENEVIDESQEWRSFSDSTSAEKNDRNRAGAIGNEWLSDGSGGGTSIAGVGSLATALSRTQFVLEGHSATDRGLSKAINLLRQYVSTLGLADQVYSRACEIVKTLDKTQNLKNKVNSAWMLAVLYLACRIEKAARLVSDLIVADPNVTESIVQKYFWKLNKILQTISSDSLVREHQTQGPEAFLNRYGSRLELVQYEVVAEKIATQISSTSALLGARNPAVIAAVSLYLVAHLADAPNKPDIDKLAQVTQLKSHTLRNCYLTLKQHIHRFLPSDFVVRLPGGIAALPS